jgi:hypothetical protein
MSNRSKGQPRNGIDSLSVSGSEEDFVTLPPVETSKGSAVDNEINHELAIYNKTQNALALWAVLKICARERIPLPEGVSDFFAKAADKLLGYANDGVQHAREYTADVALGTKNSGGGPSVFATYRAYKKRAAMVARVVQLLLEDAKKGSLETQTKIYQRVAEEYNSEPETVKRYFEADEADAGSFDIRYVRRKLDEGPESDL